MGMSRSHQQMPRDTAAAATLHAQVVVILTAEIAIRL